MGGLFLLIHRMTATFGKLLGETLELSDGLNILRSSNETGKSTWCAFLVSMLYGINSRDRDRAGFIADKNRYAPWSGAAMSGRLDCRVGDEELTLLRATKRQTAPLGEFQAIYAGTGDPVPGLTGQACGETLLGIGREVFERSAFIRQSGLSITQDSSLERRIAALITSGEEDTSYSEAAALLKKQLNRRRHNKTGEIPALEAERQELVQRIAESEQLARQFSDAEAQADALSREEAQLSAALAQFDRWEASLRKRSLLSAQSAAWQAEEAAAAVRRQIQDEQIPENDTIGRLRGAIVNLETVRKAVGKARAERDEAAEVLLRAEAAMGESPFAGQTVEEARREAQTPPKVSVSRWPGLAVFFLGLSLAGAAAMLLYSRISTQTEGWLQVLPWGVFAAVTAASWYLSHLLRRRAVAKAQTAARRKRFGTAVEGEIAALAETYGNLLKARDAAQNDARAKSAAADALYASLSSNEQGILLEVRRFAPAAFDIPTADDLLRSCAVRRRDLQTAETAAREARVRADLLAQQLPADAPDEIETTPPAGDRDSLTAQLESVRARLSAARSSADRLSGQLHACGDPAVLRSTADHLSAQIAAGEAEYDALTLAMDTLEHANATLQNRFSPALGRRSAEIFSQLTDGRYSGVVLDRSFHLSAEPAADHLYRDAGFLSAGTVDQLYLSVRLAICELVLPRERSIPLILDDALVNFDDNRCAAALQWLKEESKHRQILLFTCHGREASFFAGDRDVSIQELTNTASLV
ncbi:MAG: AAA family ATPase [Oscillospiraceae bacterium]|nr:AAA family ATPase [Oscillospiraceae bacterium]